MSKEMRMVVDRDDPTLGYVYLSNHPKASGCVKRSKRIDSRNGVMVVLDYDENDNLIGIEIVE